jgi:hypothetical protein
MASTVHLGLASTWTVTRLIRSWRTIGIIRLFVAVSGAPLSSGEQIHELSIEAWPLNIIGEGSVVRMDEQQIGETWKPCKCWIQGGSKVRLGLI